MREYDDISDDLTDADLSMRKFTIGYFQAHGLKKIRLFPLPDDPLDMLPEKESIGSIGDYPITGYIFSDGERRMGIDVMGNFLDGIAPGAITQKEIDAMISFIEQ